VQNNLNNFTIEQNKKTGQNKFRPVALLTHYIQSAHISIYFIVSFLFDLIMFILYKNSYLMSMYFFHFTLNIIFSRELYLFQQEIGEFMYFIRSYLFVIILFLIFPIGFKISSLLFSGANNLRILMKVVLC